MLQARRVSLIIVGATLIIPIFFYIWVYAPVHLVVKWACTVLLLWECTVLINKEQRDTLTEALAELSGALLVIPFGMGYVFGYFHGSHMMTDPILNAIVFTLMGHFFFSQGQKVKELTND